MTGTSGTPAVFLDRDGTVTKHVGYVTEPGQIELIDGVGESIRALREAGFACILITNQSAIGRGMLTVEKLEQIHDALQAKLKSLETQLDAIYFAPQMPLGTDETIVEYRDRKPGPGMLIRAAADLQLDLSRSWMVGDRQSDVLAGINANCRSILVANGYTYGQHLECQSHDYPIMTSVSEAAEYILRVHK